MPVVELGVRWPAWVFDVGVVEICDEGTEDLSDGGEGEEDAA